MNLLCCSQGPVSAACRVSAVPEGIPQCWRVPSFGVFPEHHSYGASRCLPKSKCSEEKGNGKAQSLQEAGLWGWAVSLMFRWQVQNGLGWFVKPAPCVPVASADTSGITSKTLRCLCLLQLWMAIVSPKPMQLLMQQVPSTARLFLFSSTSVGCERQGPARGCLGPMDSCKCGLASSGAWELKGHTHTTVPMGMLQHIPGALCWQRGRCSGAGC